MRLLITLVIGFGVAFGVGWLAGFSHQTDWLAGLVLSSAVYISIQVDELNLLVLESVPNAKEHARIPNWMKARIGQ